MVPERAEDAEGLSGRFVRFRTAGTNIDNSQTPQPFTIDVGTLTVCLPLLCAPQEGMGGHVCRNQRNPGGVGRGVRACMCFTQTSMAGSCGTDAWECRSRQRVSWDVQVTLSTFCSSQPGKTNIVLA